MREGNNFKGADRESDFWLKISIPCLKHNLITSAQLYHVSTTLSRQHKMTQAFGAKNDESP